MKEKWTGDLIGKMHVYDVTYDDLASELGWVKGYIGMILNGQRNPMGAKEKLFAAFDAIVARRKAEKKVSNEKSV